VSEIIQKLNSEEKDIRGVTGLQCAMSNADELNPMRQIRSKHHIGKKGRCGSHEKCI
jgi:hypothetical protein